MPSALPSRFSTTMDAPLDGDIDLEATLAEIPEDFAVKGMFFARYVNALEGEWERVAEELKDPARHGRYHAFEDYPMRDYVRVFDRVARARFPGSTREAYRLLARGEVEVFSETTLGKVTFSLMREPSAALMKYPHLMSVVARGPVLSAERVGERHVRVTHERFFGALEQGLGLVEGLVLAFDGTPTVEVAIAEPRRVVFDAMW